MNDAARALWSRATDPASADTMLFARLIGARIEKNETPLLGLDAAEFAALMHRHFPGAAFPAPAEAPRFAPHQGFVRDLHALLMWHDRTAARHPEDAHCLATIIAAASLRPDHLWRDLGLASREDVTAMLDRHYPDLIARNVANLRWKKFFAQQVAHANGTMPTCAPGCPGCEDYTFCYPDKPVG
jgi:nitrogen fixation protein NifQ